LPWKWTSLFCAKLGSLTFFILREERIKTINNLSLAYGKEKSESEIFAMAKEVFSNFGRASGELAIKMNLDDAEKFFSNVEVVGKEYPEAAYALGKGIINLVPHMGCWEALPRAYTLLGFAAGSVVQTLSNKKINDWVLKNREFKGFKVLPRGSSYKTILQFLKQNNSLGMLIDVDTRVKSVFVDFYGIPAHTPIGAAMLALDSDATVFTTSYIRTEGNKYQFIYGPPLEITRTGDRKEDLRINTENFHKEVEKIIKKYPTQWTWMHERWKTTPEMIEERERVKQELRKKRREERLKENALK
jgi:KDO2-lipid IV(A) lauroyltransferase